MLAYLCVVPASVGVRVHRLVSIPAAASAWPGLTKYICQVVCIHARLYLRMHVCAPAHPYTGLSACMAVCMGACMAAHLRVPLHGCAHVCLVGSLSVGMAVRMGVSSGLHVGMPV